MYVDLPPRYHKTDNIHGELIDCDATVTILQAPASRIVNQRTLLQRNASSEEGLAQTLLRKGLEVTQQRKVFLASLGPQSTKPTSAQQRRASVRTSILSQLQKTARWQSEHSLEEVVVKKETPPPPPGSRSRSYTMPSLESLKAKYNL